MKVLLPNRVQNAFDVVLTIKLHNIALYIHALLYIIDSIFDLSIFSTVKMSDVKMHVQTLLNRHSMVFGNYRWTEFDEPFLDTHVESLAIVDLEDTVAQVCYFDLLWEYF